MRDTLTVWPRRFQEGTIGCAALSSAVVLAMVGGGLAVVGTLGLLAGIWASLLVVALAALVGLVALAVPAAAAYRVAGRWDELTERFTWMEVGPGRLHRLSSGETLTVDSVSLEGEIGDWIRVVVETGRGRRILVHRAARAHGPWAAAHVIDGAHALAEQLGRPLDDRTDSEAWRRWIDDARYRAHLRLARRVAASVDAYGRYHAMPADEEGLAVGLDGWRHAAVVLHRDRLRIGPTWVDLADVQEAGVVVEQRSYSLNNIHYTQDEVFALVRNGGRIREVSLGKATPRLFQRARWMMEDVERRAAGHRVVDEGTHEDVPAAMRRMRAADAARRQEQADRDARTPASQ
jgi:hypothetical protein